MPNKENIVDERLNEIMQEEKIIKHGSMALLGFNFAFAGALIVLIMYTLVQFGESLLTVLN